MIINTNLFEEKMKKYKKIVRKAKRELINGDFDDSETRYYNYAVVGMCEEIIRDLKIIKKVGI